MNFVSKLFHNIKEYFLSMKKTFISFFIIIIFSVAPSIAISVYANMLLLNNAEEINSKCVTSLTATIDSTLKNLINKSYFIALNEPQDFNTLSYPVSKYSSDFATASENISKFTSQFTSDLDVIDNIFVYFKKPNYLITSSGSFDYGYYFKKYYSYEQYPSDYWTNLIKSKTNLRILPTSKVYRYDENGKKQYYRTVIPIAINPNKDAQTGSIVVVNVDQQKIMNLIRDLNVPSSGYVFIWDPNNENVVSSNGNRKLIDMLPYSKMNFKKMKNAGRFELNYSSKLYEIIYKRSSSTNLIYAAVIPKTAIKKQIYVFSYITVAIILLFALVIMAISSNFIKWLHNSVTHEVELLKDTFKIPVIQSHDQFSSLKEGVEYICTQNQNNMEIIMKMFFYRAIQNRITKEDVSEFISRYSEYSQNNYYKLVVIQFNFRGSIEISLNTQDMEGIENDVYNTLQAFSHMVISDNSNSYVVFLASEHEDTLLLKLQALHRELSNYINIYSNKIELVSASSDDYNDLMETSFYYEQAINIINNRGISKNNIIFSKNDLASDDNSFIPVKLKKSLQSLMDNPNMINVFELIERYNNKLFDANISFTRFKQLNYDLLFIAFEIINSNSLKTENIFNKNEKDLLNIFDSIITPLGIFNFCVTIYKKTSTCLSNETEMISKVDKTIIQYIENHIDTVNLCILSEKLNMNQNYVFQYFKKHFGVTFLEYLSGKRIEKAKYLLETTKFSVSKVGQMVGFNSPNSFIRMFKKFMYVTPSEYRNKVSSKQ